MTVREVSKRMGVSEETVRRWIRDGKLPASIKSKKNGYVITEESVALLERSSKQSWMDSKEAPLKSGTMEFLVVMGGMPMIMTIRSAEPEDVKRFIEQLDIS